MRHTSPNRRRGLAGRLAVLAILIGATATPLAAQQSNPARQDNPEGARTMTQTHPYVGMWVTADGHVRQELLPNGRYDEARGTRKSAYQGRYEVKGTQIDYWDDTGFTADGVFVDPNTLHHGGMVFHRER